MILLGESSMQRLIEIFKNNGFQIFDRRVNHFDLVLEIPIKILTPYISKQNTAAKY